MNREPTARPQTDLSVESIFLARGDRAPTAADPRSAGSFDEAEEILATWSVDYPTTNFEPSEPISFDVCFRNGFVWKGKFRLHYGGTDHHDRLLREAVLESLLFASGRQKPAGLTRAHYLRSLANLGINTVRASARILDECPIPDLGCGCARS